MTKTKECYSCGAELTDEEFITDQKECYKCEIQFKEQSFEYDEIDDSFLEKTGLNHAKHN